MKLETIGMGTWLVTDQQVLNDTIKTAYENGYRLIDTAQAYNNETQIANALKANNINREEIWITSKVAFQNIGKHAYKSTMQSLKRLDTNYIDLMLLHAYIDTKSSLNGYKDLMKLREEGYVKHIGVSNYGIDNLKEIYNEFGEYPANNQIVTSPTERIKDLEEFCLENNITLTGYSIIKPYYNPNPFYAAFELSNEERTTLEQIAKQTNRSVADVLNKWAIQNNYHIIPKSEKTSRIATNNKLDFNLDNDQMNLINAMAKLTNSNDYQKQVQNFKKMLPEGVTLEQVFEQGLLFDKNF